MGGFKIEHIAGSGFVLRLTRYHLFCKLQYKLGELFPQYSLGLIVKCKKHLKGEKVVL